MGALPQVPTLKKLMRQSALIAMGRGDEYVGTNHLVAAVFLSDDPKIKALLSLVGIDEVKAKDSGQILMSSK